MVTFSPDNEIEVKFFVKDLPALEKKLVDLKATLVQPRTHEYNLRFDTPSGELGQAGSVLRLRRDTESYLTYKGPSTTLGGVLARKELEFEVSNFEQAQKFVEALGFRSKFIYEKHRTTYDLQGLKITLDEMPYGDFVEIEGPSVEVIQEISERMKLNWEKAVPETYISIFARMKELASLAFKDITFKNFEDVNIDMVRMGIQPGDQ